MEDFYSPSGTISLLLTLLGKERIYTGVGLEQQMAFEKTKILGTQMSALSISQAGLPFELDVSMTPEGMAETSKGENTPGFWSQL